MARHGPMPVGSEAANDIGKGVSLAQDVAVRRRQSPLLPGTSGDRVVRAWLARSRRWQLLPCAASTGLLGWHFGTCGRVWAAATPSFDANSAVEDQNAIALPDGRQALWSSATRATL